MTDTIRPFIKADAIKALRDTLLKNDIDKLESQYGVLEGILSTNAPNFEKDFLAKSNTEDRFGYYQIFILDKKIEEDVKFVDAEFAGGFLSAPQKEVWYKHQVSNTEMAFGKYAMSEKRVERIERDEAGQEMAISVLEPKDVFLCVSAEIVKTQKKWVVIIKYPWYRRKLSQRTYGFQTEAAFITGEVAQLLQTSLKSIELKEFFLGFKPPKPYYDKAEFRVSGLVSESGLQNQVAMRFASPENGLSNAYQNLDKILASSLSSSLLEKFKEKVEATASLKDNKAEVLKVATDFFEGNFVSAQEVFEILTQTFEFGLGTITYSKGKDVFQYKIDYSEDINSLIRSSKLGWDVFEHLWTEIEKFIDQ